MKILFCNDTEDNYHYGCTATSLGIKNELKKYGKVIGSHTVFDSWNNQNYPKNIDDFDDPDLFNKWSEQNTTLIEKIEQADLCVINGEGTIHGFPDRPGTQNLLYLAYILKKNFGKKVHIINHSCFPIYSPYDPLNEICTIYKKVYQLLDFVAVRDVYSLAILNKIGINAVLAFDCLPLYVKNLFKETPVSIKGSYVCLSGGAAFFLKFKKFLKHDLKKYRKHADKFVFLVSDTKVVSQDDQICIDLINRYNKKWYNRFRKIEIYHAKNVDEWLSVIKNTTLMVSGRFHHSIACKCFSVPYVCFDSNSPKMTVLRDIKHHDDLIDLAYKNFPKI